MGHSTFYLEIRHMIRQVIFEIDFRIRKRTDVTLQCPIKINIDIWYVSAHITAVFRGKE